MASVQQDVLDDLGFEQKIDPATALIEEKVISSLDSRMGTKRWKTASDDLFFPKWISTEKEGSATCKCRGLVQASPQDVLAFLFDYDSNFAMEAHVKRNGMNFHHFPRYD